MKKTIMICIAALAIGAGASYATDALKGPEKTETAKADCADCPMHKAAGAKKCADKMCPEAMEGIKTFAKNIDKGVEITMTAGDPDAIAKLQELTLVHYGSKDTMDKECPARVEGAEHKLVNTPNGVKVLLTGKTPAVIKKIQLASAKERMKAGCPEEQANEAKAGSKHACPDEHAKEAKSSKKYACPMKCAESDKPGKCPKCGMNMKEKK